MASTQTTKRKTTRTGFDDQQVPTRWAYSFARSEGRDDHEAMATAARGLPLHMVEKWTRDLCRAGVLLPGGPELSRAC
jgi:hypothetical protein